MISDGVHLQELQGEFDIKNFEATCFARTLVQSDPEKDDFKIESPTLFSAGGYKFNIFVGWLTRKDGANIIPDENSQLGCNFHVSSDNADLGKCCGRPYCTLVNKDPSKNVEHTIHGIRRLSPDWCWWPRKNTQKGLRVRLQEIFDEDQGWLHDGTLRINVKLLYAIDDQVKTTTSMKVDYLQDLSTDWAALFRSAVDTDVVIKVKGEEMNAHSLVLKARSSVLAATLSAPMRESANRELIIDDLDVSAIKLFIKFLYCGQLDVDVLKSDDLALDVLEAAHRYNVPSLEQVCVHTLCSRIAVDNVAEWFNIADLIGSADLRARCLEFMRGHISEVQGTEKYANLVSKRPALAVEILAGLFPPAKRLRTDTCIET